MATEHLRLLDQIERTNGRPAGYDEPRFDFLNRVRSPYWACVRDLIERWFAALPQETQTDVRGRFRSSDDGQNTAALWEMFLHESLRAEGFTLKPHPAMKTTSRRPDFLAVCGDASMYVEATVSLPPSAEVSCDRRVARMNELLNRVRSPNFLLWLAAATGLAADAMPRYRWQHDGWDIAFRAVPIKAEAPGREDHRPVGVTGPARAAFVDATTPLRSSLMDKATCYGEVDRPYVIAVVCEAVITTDDFDVEGALFGQDAMTFDRITLEATPTRLPDGFWTSSAGRREGVSGVLIARNIRPWSVGQIEPRLWHNPWAIRPVPPGLP